MPACVCVHRLWRGAGKTYTFSHIHSFIFISFHFIYFVLSIFNKATAAKPSPSSSLLPTDLILYWQAWVVMFYTRICFIYDEQPAFFMFRSPFCSLTLPLVPMGWLWLWASALVFFSFACGSAVCTACACTLVRSHIHTIWAGTQWWMRGRGRERMKKSEIFGAMSKRASKLECVYLFICSYMPLSICLCARVCMCMLCCLFSLLYSTCWTIGTPVKHC